MNQPVTTDLAIVPSPQPSNQESKPAPTANELVAANAVKSGMYKGLTVSTALMILQMAEELQIPAAQALGSIHIVQGKLVLSATLLGALVQRSGSFDYRVTENTDKAAEVEILRRVDGAWASVGKFRFSIEMAKRAELLGKSVWKQYPEAMLFSRALTAAIRMFAPSLTVVACYTPEEAETFDSPQRFGGQQPTRRMTESEAGQMASMVNGVREANS
jgi:hypothetical protein